jgi:hypothetical protein
MTPGSTLNNPKIAIRATAFVDGIRFFSLLIMNADEAEEL